MHGQNHAISKLGYVAASAVLAGWLITAPAVAAPSPAPDSTANPASIDAQAATPSVDPENPEDPENAETGDPESPDPAPDSPAEPPAATQDPPTQAPAPAPQPPAPQPTSAEPPVVSQPAPAPVAGPTVAPPAPAGPLPIIPPTASPPIVTAPPTTPPPPVVVPSSPPGILLPVPPGLGSTGSSAPSPAALPALPAGAGVHWHTGGPQDGHLPGWRTRPAPGPVEPVDDSADDSPHLLRTTTVTSQDQVAVITVLLIALAVLGLPLRRALERAVTHLAGLLPRRRRRRLYGERWVNQHLTLSLVPAVPVGAPSPAEHPQTHPAAQIDPAPRLRFSWDRGPVLGRPAEAR